MVKRRENYKISFFNMGRSDLMTAGKDLLIYKANNLIHATYKLTLNEQRVVLACIAKVDSTKPLSSADKFELSAKEFAEIFKIDEANAYGQLLEVENKLFERKIVIKEDGETIKTRWISTVKYQKDAGRIQLYFAQGILPYLSQLQARFTRYSVDSISGMRSIYGIRLFELLMQWQSTGRLIVEIENLKQQLEITDDYKRIYDFKKWVVEVAVNDINTNSNLIVHPPIYERVGRKVARIVFDFKIKPKQKPIASKKTKPSPEPQQIDNIKYFADMRKRFGDSLPVDAIPLDVINQLKATGRW